MAHNKLRRFFLKHVDGLQAARQELAAKLGCHPVSLRMIDSDLRLPSWDFACAIEDATGGKVRASALRPRKRA